MFRCLVLMTCSLLSLTFVADALQTQPVAKDQYGDALPPGLARMGSLRWRHGGITTFAAFLPDGKSVITVGDDWTIRVWEYPSGKEIRRIGRETPPDGETRNYRAAALSPDGKTIAVCFDNRVLHLRDVATGKELPRLVINQGVAAPAFSPNSKELASLDLDGFIHLWDWAKGQEIRQMGTFVTTTLSSPALFFSPDGKWIAEFTKKGKAAFGGKGGKAGKGSTAVRFWDPNTGVDLFTLTAGKKVNLRSAAASPNGKMLAFSSADGTVMVVDSENGNDIHTLASEKQGAEALLFSADGTKLYARAPLEQRIREWDVTTGQLLRTLGSGLPANVSLSTTNPAQARLTLSPDGNTLVLSGYERTPQFLDLKTGKEHVVVNGSATPLTALRYTPDGKNVLTKDATGQTRQWDAATGKDLGPLQLPGQHLSGVISPDGKIVASAAPMDGAGIITLADAATGKVLAKTFVFPMTVPKITMQFSPDGKTLAARVGHNTVELYEVPGGKLLRTFDLTVVGNNGGYFGGLTFDSILFSPDGTTLAIPIALETMSVWDVTTGLPIGRLTTQNDSPILAGGFSPDGRCVALDANDGTVALYEVATGQIRRTYGQRQLGSIRIGTDANQRIAFSQDGKLLVHAGHDRAVRVWDVATGKELAAFKGHTGALTAVAFAPNGKTLASASMDTTALVWDVSKLLAVANASGSSPAKALQRDNLDKLWEALADKDGAAGFAAIANLAAAPKQAVGLIKEKIKPALASDGKEHQRWIAQLDHESYQDRQAAHDELLKIGEPALLAIHKALAAGPAPEARRRLESLRAILTSRELRGERLREYRAVEILERIGTPEARQVLQALANGAPGALLTTSAQAAVKR